MPLRPFRLFERLIDPVAPPGEAAGRLLGSPVPETAPPRTLPGFYWHFLKQTRALLFAMGALVLIARPCALLLQNLITQQAINGNFTSRIRWQSNWKVVPQG